MFFKNVQLFKFTRLFKTTADELEAQMQNFKFKECGAHDFSSFGFVSPIHSGGPGCLVHESGGHILICAKLQEKIIPPSVIREMHAESVAKIENEMGRPLNKKEKAGLKDELIMALLPRAFTKSSYTYAWIDVNSQTVAIDASSGVKADNLLSLLRTSLGSLPVAPFSLKTPLEITMTEWVRDNNAPSGFTLEDRATLSAVLEHGGTITAKDQDLSGDEIKASLDADKLVTKLSMSWGGRISFELSDQMAIKKLKFSDALIEQSDDAEDDATRDDADFFIMTETLSEFINELLISVGGEQEGGL